MIFRDFAPLYWNAGLPVMPLKRWDSPSKGKGKAPILNEWTSYGEVMPSEAMRASWLVSYPESNIGLPFGNASGLCAIDIDTEDQEMVKAIREALPPSPWVRVGKKGMGLIYRWQGQPNFKLRNSENQSIVEFLGKGNQMVLPPSIHPDTGKPYTADTNLWEVLDKIVALPLDVERVLREALSGVAGVSLAASARSAPLDVVPQGERDIQMVRHAGYLARVVLGIDKTTRFSLSEAMKHMTHWIENFTAHTSGDDMDPDKGVAKLVEFLLKDVEKGRTLPEGWDVGLTDDQRAHPAIAEMIKKNAIQRWTVSKAQRWLIEKIAEQPNDSDYALARIDEIVELVAKDENFSESHFLQLVATIQQEGKAYGFKFGKPDLKNQFKLARQGDSEQAQDHEAIARQVFEEMSRGGDLVFSQGKFWQWSGACHQEISEDDVYMEIAESIKGNTLAKRHNDYAAIVKTVGKVARGPLGTELEVGINFANGFLDADLHMHEHSPKYGKTFTLPFNYIPERAGEAHKWMEYLESSWGDDADYAEKVAALQEAFAATMFGVATSYQRAILLHGKAGTGKTQGLEVLKAMMPPAAQCAIPPTLWAERFQLSGMTGKTLNVCGELPEEATIDGRAFKEVIEGTGQHTELKGRDAFEFCPIAAHWFGSNFLPRSRDTSGGFVRRWLILDYNRVVPAHERITDFSRMIIAEEREAIAAWAVQGLARLMRQRDYTLPKSHETRINQVLRSNNSVAAFLQSSDKVRPAKGQMADARVVFDQYIFYMKDVSRGFGVTYERFQQMLGELGHECEPYRDPTGVLRHRAVDLKIVAPELPK